MSSILQVLYDLVHWQYFGIIAIIWTLVDLVWVKRWQDLVKRIGILVTKPIIFKKDKEPKVPALYPREFLEELALNSRRDQTVSEPSNEGMLTRWRIKQGESLFDPTNPKRSFGYVLSFTLFLFFLVADAIVVAATLVLMGVISPDLPPILQRLEYAILGGAILFTVVGIWMLVEMSGKGELVNTDILTSSQKMIFKLFAVITTLFAVAVMVALAVQRLISLGYLQSSPTTDLILSFVLYGLLAINNSLAAALTFQQAASGLLVIVYLLILLVVGALPILAFLADVIWRGLYVIIDILVWALFTPIIAIPFGFASLIGLITGDNSSQ
jgi:hypothetical protein